MPQIRNDSPLGDLDVPLLRRIVRAGETVDVTDDQASRLLPQDIWTAVDDAAHSIQSAIEAAESEGDDQ